MTRASWVVRHSPVCRNNDAIVKKWSILTIDPARLGV
jgi:hypothetical protein